MNELYISQEFDAWFSTSEFREQTELFYPLLVAWSRGQDHGAKMNHIKENDELFAKLFARQEMGG